MDHLQKYVIKVRTYVLSSLLFSNVVIIVALWLGLVIYDYNPVAVILAVWSFMVIWSVFFSYFVGNRVSQPLSALWQAILHVSPGHSQTPPPNIEKLKLGREMITSLSLQVYQLASSEKTQSQNNTQSNLPTIANSLPLPTFVLDKEMNIIFVNEIALSYINRKKEDVVGENAYSILDLAFPTENTFDIWLNQAKTSKVTDSSSWDRVRLRQPDRPTPLQFDMAAYYNKNNPSGVETIITLFDHTAKYQEDDDSLSFIALTVHELRTPLTLLRGYIEVFEEELENKLDPELNDYLNKMHVASQQLTAFVDNILNVARVEADQLVLQLNEENWSSIIKNVASDLSLRAKLRHKTFELQIDPNIPPIAADRVSIYEVLSNLLDNAIKYGEKSDKIIIKSSVGKDGKVETTVTDYGVGIPTTVLPNLFEKFYRNFKTKQSIGGTGLGLYLCKAIVNAHGGNIWVQSKEGQGTTFGFTIQPYQMLAEELKNSNNKDIVRSAHGWIKNHSLYRR